jgi:membrane protease YdiL (CAAX protease family)
MTDLAVHERAQTGQARKGLVIYFLLVAIGSAFFEWRILRSGEQVGANIQLVFALMWTPGIASIIARLLLREGFADVSFRWGGRAGTAACGLALLFPLIVGLVAYGIAWATGLAQFQSARIAARLPALPVPIGFLISLAFSATVGALVGCLSAAGEEIGWRGYMLTRLIDARVPKPVLVSGIVWGAWHTPLILSGQYAAGAHPYVSALLFMVNIVAFAYLAAHLRLSSGSVWPAVLVHAAWNAIIQGPFDRNTVGTPLAVGESGYLTTAVTIAVVVWMLRRQQPDGARLVRRSSESERGRL